MRVPAKNRELHSEVPESFLQNYADKPAAALIDYFLKRFLNFSARFLRHFVQLRIQPLVDKFMKRFSENIALPYLFRVFFKPCQQKSDKFFRLFFAAHNGGDFGLNICFDYMVRRRGRFKSNAEPVALFYYFRLIECQCSELRCRNRSRQPIQVHPKVCHTPVLTAKVVLQAK